MRLDRRTLLKGLGGAVLGLPMLEAFAPRRLEAQAMAQPRFAVWMRQANGVQQLQTTPTPEPESFWPVATGPLTTALMTSRDAGRAVGVLAPWASRLLVVRGVNYASIFRSSGCAHSTGGNFCLTAQQSSSNPTGNKSLAMGESADNRIARALNAPGVEPLTLYAGAKLGYIDEVLSYSGPMALRYAEQLPLRAYTRLVDPTGSMDPATMAALQSARVSVNDLVRDRLTALMRTPALSGSDRARLQTHFEAVRDLEMRLATTLSSDELAAMSAAGAAAGPPSDHDETPGGLDGDRTQTLARLHADLIAFAFASGATHAATLQIGEGNAHQQYTIDGVVTPYYHQISHRVLSDGDLHAAPIANAVSLHHRIDMIHAQLFDHLLTALSAYTLPSGAPLLDSCVAVWTNDLATGLHSETNLPYVIAGSGGGYLRQGQYVDAGGVTHNQLLNTIINATGVRNADGSPVTDFGDARLAGGEIAAMKA